MATGFDCEFVKKPQREFQSECPVCLQVLREPYQVSCCGNSFCHPCINRIKTDNKPCPTCNDQNFSTFHDKRLQRSLYEFQVYCSHKQEGCDWKGELGQLDNHLKLSGDCPITVIDCDFHHVGCDMSLPRKDMPAHLNENLVTHMSLQSVSYSKLQASHEDLKASHSKLQDTTNKLERENDSLRKENQQAAAKVNELEGKIETLTQLAQAEAHAMGQQPTKLQVFSGARSTGVQQALAVPTLPDGPVEFTMENFRQYKNIADVWYSPPFYTGPGGYRFCLKVYANGSGSGRHTHVTVYVCLMRGEFDDHLKFPFRGAITVQLVDQEGGEEHWPDTINFAKQTPDDIAGRVTEGERQEQGRGRYQFISHGELKPKYLKNDCLHFRVIKMKVTV